MMALLEQAPGELASGVDRGEDAGGEHVQRCPPGTRVRAPGQVNAVPGDVEDERDQLGRGVHVAAERARRGQGRARRGGRHERGVAGGCSFRRCRHLNRGRAGATRAVA